MQKRGRKRQTQMATWGNNCVIRQSKTSDKDRNRPEPAGVCVQDSLKKKKRRAKKKRNIKTKSKTTGSNGQEQKQEMAVLWSDDSLGFNATTSAVRFPTTFLPALLDFPWVVLRRTGLPLPKPLWLLVWWAWCFAPALGRQG